MEAVLKDKRFAHVAKDPRFRRMPKGDRKVKIDKRFKDMFNDDKFKLKYTVDARGRPVNLSTNENLKKFYELSDSDSSEDDSIQTEQTGLQKSDSENSSENSGSFERFKQEKEESFSDIEEVKTKEKTKKKECLEARKKKDKKKETNKTVKKTDDSEEGDTVNSISNGDKMKQRKMEKKSKKQKEKEDELTKESIVLSKEVDYARGEGMMDSSSSEEEDSEDEDNSEQKNSTEFDHRWNEQDENVEEVSEATRRLAVCNMDWDRIKASDIFFILSSFKPPKGVIQSVKIYPSEFGKERMAEEKLMGPRELRELKGPETGEDQDEEVKIDKEGVRYQTEKLRAYQLLRLRYHYAVVECDSVSTADHIYQETDGKEYESSATKVDLRFIPDDMEFEDEPASVCTGIPVDYKPNFFFNTALSQSKVDLTWDETDRDRTHKIAKQFEPTPADAEEDDLNAYLASSSDEEGVDYGGLVEQSDSSASGDSEEEGNEERQISKYRQLLQDLDQQEKKKQDLDVQMEITWEPGLKEATEEIVRKKAEVKSQTPWEDYLERKKQKKRQRQQERKQHRQQQLAAKEPGQDEEEEEEAAFSDDDLPAGVDMDDPFFASDSKKKTKSKKDNKKKKNQKKDSQETEEDEREREALSLLVMGEEDDKKHFNVRKLVDSDKKGKKMKKKDKMQTAVAKKEDDFTVNVEDPRFSAMYESHLFNIDPSAPEFRKTKGTEAIVEEKLKRSKKKGNKLQQEPRGENPGAKKRKAEEVASARDESLASLVNSVKMKTKNFTSKKTKTKS